METKYEQYKLHLKRLANIRENEIIVVRTIPEEEEKELLDSFEIINIFNKLNDRFGRVVLIHAELCESLTKINDGNKVERLVLELMSAFRAFLDHSETYLKRRYGKESKNFAIFKAATSKEYDNVFAYRFIYELRHYIQHCDFPDISIEGKNLISGNNEYSLLVKKTPLLTGFDWKPVIRQDLLKLPVQFDILPLLNDLIQSVQRLNTTSINCSIDIGELFRASKKVVGYKQYLEQDCQLCILEYKNWGGPTIPTNMEFRVFPIDTAEFLLMKITAKAETPKR